MVAWLGSGIGGEKGGKYCCAAGSASSEICGGAVVYTGMLDVPVVMSASETGGE
jgi:hypothetical protein